MNTKNIEETIANINIENDKKINWTKAWSKKYPILKNYQKEVNIKKYSYQIRNLLEDLKSEYKFNELDAMLVLKDILYHEWKNEK